jgi:glutathione synthase/RimK-type ligase-like ATP-grasp enzyme
MKPKIAGLKRKLIYSPNHTINDLLIITKTADVLRTLGFDVTLYDESHIENNDLTEKYIFSMARGLKALNKLKEMESSGTFIINSPVSALNTHRVSMINLLVGAGIPFPKSVILEKDSADDDFFKIFNSTKLWLKRGDIHAEHREDVTLVYSKEELNSIVQEFHKRGINKSIVQEHLPGDTIKFYGVRGTDFFHWYYVNGGNHILFNHNNLKTIAFNSAEILGLTVFGGDVILSPEGKLSVIDINDWPSFAPVRDKASEYIGRYINDKILSYAQY